jgi:transcriptional regulator of acetoin/glycerol metabolism
MPDAEREGKPASLRSRDHLVLVLECDQPLAGSARYAISDVDEVALGRGSRRSADRRLDGGHRALEIRVPSRAMSASHARLYRDGEEWIIQDLKSTNGTRVNGKPVTRHRVRPGDCIEAGRVVFFLLRALDVPGAADLDVEPPGAREGTPAATGTLLPSLCEVFAELARVAPSTLPVLILGETGTGKELVSRELHRSSGRTGALVPVNCAALPDTLFEAQLFGHSRGAFSGAIRAEPGLVRAADKGTLFLDEVGDLPLPAQAALLRTLQEREVLPIGNARPVAVDVRVVSATHRDLDAMVAAGAFREDLLARLRGHVLRLPALRERRADLGLIVGAILRVAAGHRAAHLAIDPAAAAGIFSYAWPANVRELEQTLRRACMLATENVLRPEHFPAAMLAPARQMVDEDPREVLVRGLKQHRGNVAAVARSLGKAPTQIFRWMRRFGIDPNAFRPGLPGNEP